MNRIDFEKCEKIYVNIKERHCTGTVDFSNAKLWASSAREIEFELYGYWQIENEITYEEYIFIFGMICKSALSFAKGDFFRA